MKYVAILHPDDFIDRSDRYSISTGGGKFIARSARVGCRRGIALFAEASDRNAPVFRLRGQSCVRGKLPTRGDVLPARLSPGTFLYGRGREREGGGERLASLISGLTAAPEGRGGEGRGF